MKYAQSRIVETLAVGLLTLIILSITLFWARKACQAIFYENALVDNADQVNIQPSGLMPELDKNPETVTPSSIQTDIRDDIVTGSLGIIQEGRKLIHGAIGEFCVVTGDTNQNHFKLIRYDTRRGLLVLHDVLKQEKGWEITPILYVGADGTSKTADTTLEPFSKPCHNLWLFNNTLSCLFLYDTGQSCFFKIQFNEGIIEKSRQIFDVVQLGGPKGFTKNADALGPLEWITPMKKQLSQDEGNVGLRPYLDDKGRPYDKLVSVLEPWQVSHTTSFEDLLILEQNGDIRRLNSQTLDISDRIAALPVFDKPSDNPEALFAYIAEPFMLDGQYKGSLVAGMSRGATMLWVLVFDEKGKMVNRQLTAIDFFGVEGGWALAITNYLLENLQPPLLGIASYFTASSFEAVDGHTGLFLLPNSWVAIFHRTANGVIVSFFGALLIISPSILLGLILGFCIYKNAAVMGLSKRQKQCWLFAAILFGLSAYITYRLTRPREVLVTCQHCGKMRRPDMLRCHRCNSPWQAPELVPPEWRILSKPTRVGS